LFDVDAETWGSVSEMVEPRAAPAVVLRDGRVLVAGGTAESGGYKTELASAEIFDPVLGRWSAVESMHVARAQHSLTLLDDGRVLAIGGSEYNFSSSTSTAEIFDPHTGRWSVVGPMRARRRAHAATLLPDGDVLVTGGYPGGVRTSEVYTPCR
jgi:N-acetylneuraminic acid mutarotase